MKHWKVDYAIKFGDVMHEDFFVVTAPCVKEAVNIAVDTLDHIADGSTHCIWNIGIIEEEIF